MKTIVYQFFIYFFLTTIYGAIDETVPLAGAETSAGPPKSTTDHCRLRFLFSTMNNTKDCPKLLSTSSDSSSNSNGFPALYYLCTGIVDGVGRICQLHPDLNSDTSIPHEANALETTINALPNLKNVTGFCNAMNEVIRNSLYVAIIKKVTSGLDITKSNDLLHKKCNVMCDNLDDSVNPLCSALFWINRLLLDIEKMKPIQKQEIVQPDVKNQSPDKSGQPNEGIVQTNTNGQSPDKSGQPNKGILQPNTKIHSADKLGQDNKEKLHTGNINDTPLSGSIVKKENTDTVNQVQDKSYVNGASPSELVITLAATKTGTAGASTRKEEKPIVDKVNPPLKMTEDIDKTKEENAARGQLSKNNDRGEEQSALEEPNIPMDDENRQRMKDRITEDNNDKGNENTVEIDGSSQVGKDDDIELDPLGAGDTPDINDQNIIARSGPPEPPQHFFAYFMAISLTCLLCYIGYHKKQKIMAIVFEGRKSRGGRGRRRPNTASYRKLDCTLEEAVTSQCNSNVTHVIY